MSADPKESREILTLLTEADLRSFCLRIMRQLRDHPSTDSYKRGLRLFANPLPDPRTSEEQQLHDEFWSVVFQMTHC